MSVIGLYRPGVSVVHRLPAGWKLLIMFIALVAVVAVHQPWQLGLAGVVVAGGFAVARIPPRVIWWQLRPLRWFLLFVAGIQLIVAGPLVTIMVCGTLLVSVAIAALVTLTTRVTDMLDVCRRLLGPLTGVGMDPDRVGLVLAMTIRCIPLLTGIVEEVSQARKARGLGFSVRALVAPAVIRALRSADAMGDALIARGVDD